MFLLLAAAARVRACQASRWNAAENLLDLSGLLDASLASVPTIPQGWANVQFCNAIGKLIETYCSTMLSLNLSSNGISNLHPLRHIAKKSAGVLRLDLSKNAIKVRRMAIQPRGDEGRHRW